MSEPFEDTGHRATEPAVPVTGGPDAGTARQRRLVVVGGGMVAQRLVEALLDRGDRSGPSGSGDEHPGGWVVDVLTEEPHAPYDRVGLTSYFAGRSPQDLLLGDPATWDRPGVGLHLSTAVDAVDTAARVVRCGDREVPYDALVLATGSSAFVPPVEGVTLPGVYVYRTLEDVRALEGWVHARRRNGSEHAPLRGVVVGGGLLGLEAAGALTGLGDATTVVEFADRLMPQQVDAGGGEALCRLITATGVEVRTAAAAARLVPGDDGAVEQLELTDGGTLEADVVVIATGIRPRDELARAAGLEVGPRG